MSNEISVIEELPPNERYALEYHRSKHDYPLAPQTQAQLFQLYLQGHDCAEIRRLRPNFSLGQIVDAKVSGQWDEMRRDHITRLMHETRAKVTQTQLESVEYVCNLIAAAHRLQGDKVKRFLMTGDPKDLGDAGIGSFKQYKEVLATLQQILRPADSTQRVVGEVVHTHRAEVPGRTRDIEPDDSHSKILRSLLDDENA